MNRDTVCRQISGNPCKRRNQYGDMLIRAYHHRDPLSMDDNEWIEGVELAMWHESRMLYKQAQMLVQLFG